MDDLIELIYLEVIKARKICNCNYSYLILGSLEWSGMEDYIKRSSFIKDMKILWDGKIINKTAFFGQISCGHVYTAAKYVLDHSPPKYDSIFPYVVSFYESKGI